jgi:hypothetical protein
MSQPNGVVFYNGSSMLNGEPIIGVVTGLAHDSANPKTGPMAQAWILHARNDPSTAIKSGEDAAICGDCVHRSVSGHIGRSCYVIWWLGPTNVYKAYRAGHYTTASQFDLDDYMLGHQVRLGAYGDPAAIPYRVWLNVIRCSSGWIGYTQQWRTCDPMFSRILMASVQSEHDAEAAHSRGWRSFRVRPIDGVVRPDETICPASEEAGHSTTCEHCRLCQGTARDAKSVVIQVHGQRIKWFKAHP